LESNFSDKIIKELAKEIEDIIALIAHNPNLFPISDVKGVRKVVIKNSILCSIEFWKTKLKYCLFSQIGKTLTKESCRN